MYMSRKASEIRRFGCENNLFSAGDIRQFDLMFDMVDKCTSREDVHDIAVIIWICSITELSIKDLEESLAGIILGD